MSYDATIQGAARRADSFGPNAAKDKFRGTYYSVLVHWFPTSRGYIIDHQVLGPAGKKVEYIVTRNEGAAGQQMVVDELVGHIKDHFNLTRYNTIYGLGGIGLQWMVCKIQRSGDHQPIVLVNWKDNIASDASLRAPKLRWRWKTASPVEWVVEVCKTGNVEPRSTVLEVEKRRKGVDIVAEEKGKDGGEDGLCHVISEVRNRSVPRATRKGRGRGEGVRGRGHGWGKSEGIGGAGMVKSVVESIKGVGVMDKGRAINEGIVTSSNIRRQIEGLIRVRSIKSDEAAGGGAGVSEGDELLLVLPIALTSRRLAQ
ncbi:hypothetical protein BJV77DRAFT_964953 [Russula vinacea]|nr:hypothetical protein BJV77DRAFT_964953 [Russula vinacea]